MVETGLNSRAHQLFKRQSLQQRDSRRTAGFLNQNTAAAFRLQAIAAGTDDRTTVLVFLCPFGEEEAARW